MSTRSARSRPHASRAKASAGDQSSTDSTFSLRPAGPLQGICERQRVFQVLSNARYRTIIFTAIAWLPLAFLAILNGLALSGTKVPFFYDLDAHVRLLISLPLLIAGESFVDTRIRNIVDHFNIRDLIPPEERHRFNQACHEIVRLKSSVIIELLILGLTYGLGHWLWREHIAFRVATWYGSEVGGRVDLTTPGYWYAYFSLPLFRFMLLRWYFRLAIWYLFLARVSRIPLRLNALHPDRAGGLGFLSGSPFAFLPLLLSQTFLMSSVIADRIWHEGVSLPEYKLEIVLVLVLMLLMVLLPLTFFMAQLNRVRRAEVRQYGAMASEYVRDFWRKWQLERGKTDEAFVGSADIQSLADLGNSFAIAQDMGTLPIGRRAIIRLTLMMGFPFVPLILTMVSLESAIDRVLKMVF